MTNALSYYSAFDFAKMILPVVGGGTLTYNAARNAFLTGLRISQAGNGYYEVVRVSDRLMVCYEIGEGYAHTFLNGITIFGWDGVKPRLLAKKNWGGVDNWICFSEQYAMMQSIQMLSDYFEGMYKAVGCSRPKQEFLAAATIMITDTQRKLIA